MRFAGGLTFCCCCCCCCCCCGCCCCGCCGCYGLTVVVDVVVVAVLVVGSAAEPKSEVKKLEGGLGGGRSASPPAHSLVA